MPLLRYYATIITLLCFFSCIQAQVDEQDVEEAIAKLENVIGILNDSYISSKFSSHFLRKVEFSFFSYISLFVSTESIFSNGLAIGKSLIIFQIMKY